MTKTFQAELAMYDATLVDFQNALDGIRDGLKAETERRYRETYPKRVFNQSKAVKEPWYSPLLEDWRSKYEAKYDEMEAYKKNAGARLRSLAEREPMPSAESEVELDRTYGGNWSSQGYGANKYARAAAETVADKARFHEVEAEVKTVATGSRDRWGIAYDTYAVFAKTTAAGARLLAFKEEPPLRERVRLSWKRGVNPRVDMPFLPFGYEESHGLDYFGNDLNAGTETAEMKP